MPFTQQEITGLQTWVEIDGTHGLTAIPYDVLSASQVNAVTETRYDVSELTLNEELGDYYECGGDTSDHDAVMVLGNWFARCKVHNNGHAGNVESDGLEFEDALYLNKGRIDNA